MGRAIFIATLRSNSRQRLFYGKAKTKLPETPAVFRMGILLTSRRRTGFQH